MRSVVFVGWFVSSFVNMFVIILRPNISKAVGDRQSFPIDHQYEMAYSESNDHVIDDVA